MLTYCENFGSISCLTNLRSWLLSGSTNQERLGDLRSWNSTERHGGQRHARPGTANSFVTDQINEGLSRVRRLHGRQDVEQNLTRRTDRQRQSHALKHTNVSSRPTLWLEKCYLPGVFWQFFSHTENFTAIFCTHILRSDLRQTTKLHLVILGFEEIMQYYIFDH